MNLLIGQKPEWPFNLTRIDNKMTRLILQAKLPGLISSLRHQDERKQEVKQSKRENIHLFPELFVQM